MAMTVDPEAFGPVIPWSGADVVDSALVRRLRTQVASELADTHAERERSSEGRLSDEDERELGIELINRAAEQHASSMRWLLFAEPGISWSTDTKVGKTGAAAYQRVQLRDDSEPLPRSRHAL